jgi:hypothetical protein
VEKVFAKKIKKKLLFAETKFFGVKARIFPDMDER